MQVRQIRRFWLRQNDDFSSNINIGVPGAEKQTRAKAKCGGPSTAAAKAPPPVGMTAIVICALRLG
jgi:hypothetical protein